MLATPSRPTQLRILASNACAAMLPKIVLTGATTGSRSCRRDIVTVICYGSADMLPWINPGSFMIKRIRRRAILQGALISALVSLALLTAQAARAEDANAPDYAAIVA